MVSVVPGSAAEEAGIHAADVIVEINGERVTNSRELRNAVGLLLQGEEAQLVLYREGERREIAATIGGSQRVTSSDGAGDGRSLDDSLYFGAQLRSADSEVARRLGETGVEVIDVAQQSPAWAAGLRPGDLIYQVNQHNVGSLRDFNAAVAEADGVAALRVLREGQRLLVILS